MKNNISVSARKSLRLKNYDYASTGAYFLTLCSNRQQCIFGEIIARDGCVVDCIPSDLGQIVIEEWQKSEQIRSEVILDDFVLMPNHFHAIVWLSRDGDCRGERPLAPTVFDPTSGSLGALVGGFKAAVTTRSNRLNVAPNKVIWQRNYYEHVIRNDESLINIREYIANNPAQWALDKYNFGNR